MKKKLTVLTRIFISLMVVMSLGAVFTSPVAAQPPPLPHAFFGSLTINDEPAPIGTKVEARGEGVKTDIMGNPIITNEVGRYGTEDPLGPKLIVQGEIEDGTIITFYVNGESTGQTFPWVHGEVNRVDLAVTLSSPAVVSEGQVPLAPEAEATPKEPAETTPKPAETIKEPVTTTEGPPKAPTAPAPTPGETETTSSWPVIGGIIAAVVVVALLVYFLVIRKRLAH